jgi:low temperature requirement protein LtrA
MFRSANKLPAKNAKLTDLLFNYLAHYLGYIILRISIPFQRFHSIRPGAKKQDKDVSIQSATVVLLCAFLMLARATDDLDVVHASLAVIFRFVFEPHQQSHP